MNVRKIKTIKAYIDKYTKELFYVGTVRDDIEQKRGEELIAGGYAEEVKAKETSPEPKAQTKDTKKGSEK